ncbi:uncharacterized protein LOC122503950 isoform X5 [Leptopilina heterotoma]|uniref:uncharacterized protein LOC122503950 isoform X5 n=1 Tax=Leptopilina heterotoma TaxID=63436 RepID=UPI001CA91ABA|nr:uncharacterized protein LOC122503950 isoform X5 [Leptopilina heterotoma]
MREGELNFPPYLNACAKRHSGSLPKEKEEVLTSYFASSNFNVGKGGLYTTTLEHFVLIPLIP